MELSGTIKEFEPTQFKVSGSMLHLKKKNIYVIVYVHVHFFFCGACPGMASYSHLQVNIRRTLTVGHLFRC